MFGTMIGTGLKFYAVPFTPPIYDLTVKVTDFGMMIDAGPKFYVVRSPTLYMTLRSRSRTWNFCIAIFYNFSFFLKPSMGFIQLWRDDRALSEILRNTIPIPVHGLKVQVMDFEFFVFNFYSVSFCNAFY